MPETVSPDLQIRYAEDIALLHYLGEVPNPPQRNAFLDHRDDHERGRTLSIRNEKDLTTLLAFLSSVRNDPNHVAAVCVEEAASSWIRVMVAVNACGAGKSSYLQDVKTGFERIFEPLSGASTKSRQELEPQVFSAIVSMCWGRITSRTRIVSRGDKPSIQKLLTKAQGGLAQLRDVRNKDTFKRLSDAAIGRLDMSEQQEARGRAQAKDMEALVDSFRSLRDISNITEMLLGDLARADPPMEESCRRALLDTIKKVSLYKSAARTLVKFARQYDVLRRVEVVDAGLEASAFQRLTVAPNYAPSLQDMLERIKQAHNTKWNIGHLLKTISKKGGHGSKSLTKGLRACLASSKIHAEVQLIWHLNQHQGAVIPPRVIASHKDACYMCNAFASTHGKYTIPRTHGRVYPGWRLPAVGMPEIQQQFAQDLELRIITRVREITESGVKNLGPPLESTAPSTVHSMTTIATLDAEAFGGSDASDGNDTAVVVHEGISPLGDDGPRPSATPDRPEPLPSKSDAPGPETDGPAIVSAERAADTSHDGSSWRRVKHGRAGHVQLSRLLDLYVEYTTAASPPAEPRCLRFRARELSDEESRELADDEGPVYDVSSLSEEVACRKDCRAVRMRLGERVYKIDLGCFGPENGNPVHSV